MKYFEICDSIDTKIIGHDFPQCYKLKKGFNPDAPNSFYDTGRCWRENKFPTFIPNLNGQQLNKRSKITDSLSTCFLHVPLINKRTLDLFNEFNLSEHRIYPAKVYGKEELQYYFLFSIDVMEKYIIWNESRFKLVIRGEELNIPTVSSKDEFIEELRKLRVSAYSNAIEQIIELKVDSNFNLDFFILKRIGSSLSYFVSQRLMDAINQNEITGFSIESEFTITKAN